MESFLANCQGGKAGDPGILDFEATVEAGEPEIGVPEGPGALPVTFCPAAAIDEVPWGMFIGGTFLPAFINSCCKYCKVFFKFLFSLSAPRS